MTETERRLTEIEMALAHAEAAAEELSDVVRDQGAQIDLLTRRMEALLRRLAEIEEAAGPGAAEANVRPPHW